MSRKSVSSRRPSAGVIIGIAALVLVIAVPAMAGKGGKKLTAAKVRNIVTQQISDLASGLDVKSAKTADTATTATTANTAKIATNVFSANVKADGTTIGSIPAGATSTRTALGTYNVGFGRSLGGCTVSSSPGDPTSGPTFALTGVTLLNDTTLRVFTRTEANVVADRSFHVQAICPA